jgi:Flp pilus assembly protein TadD
MKTLTIQDPSAPNGLAPVRVRKLWLLAAAAGALLVTLAVAFGLLLTARKKTVDALVVVTLPSGAEVTFDGASLGPSPVKLDGVRIGAHTVRVMKDGFTPIERQVDVDADMDIPLEFDLKPIAPPGSVARTPEEQVQEFTGLAEDAFSRGDLTVPTDRSALYYADAILSLDRNNAYATGMRDRIREALLSAARTATRQKDFERAKEAYAQLVAAIPGDAEGTSGLAAANGQLRRDLAASRENVARGEAALRAGRLIEPEGRSAYAYASRALAADAENAQAAALRRRVRDGALRQATALAASGRIEDAAGLLGRLVALFPTDRAIRSEFDRLMSGDALDRLREHRASGLDAFRAGNYRLAVEHLQAAVALGAADSETRAALGVSLMRLGDATRARRELERSVVQDGSQREALTALGDLALRDGDVRRALDLYRRARRSAPAGDKEAERLDSIIGDLERRLRDDAPR